MIENQDRNLSTLARLISKVEKRLSLSISIKILGAFSILLFIADFTYKKYGHFDFETLPGAYGVIGFGALIVIMLGTKILKCLLKRPEEYNSPFSVAGETYPADQKAEQEGESNVS